MVEIIDEKHFYWLGRADHVINSGGVKIYPESLEPRIAQILSDNGIDNPFFLWGFPNKIFGEELTLVIEGKPF